MIYYNNLSAFTEVHLGNTNITEVYYGDVKKWPTGPQPFGGKFKLTLNDSTVVTAICDSTSAVTSGEIQTYSSTVVSVEIGDCVNEIGRMAFYQCNSLTSVDIPDNVASIGEHAFERCAGLTSVTIGNGVTTIGAYAFYDNNSLKSITIGSGCTYIGYWTFADCSGPINLTIYATTPPYVVSNAFQYSTINTIYVPAESINAYKSAPVWAGYTDKIQAIP